MHEWSNEYKTTSKKNQNLVARLIKPWIKTKLSLKQVQLQFFKQPWATTCWTEMRDQKEKIKTKPVHMFPETEILDPTTPNQSKLKSCLRKGGLGLLWNHSQFQTRLQYFVVEGNTFFVEDLS